MPTKWQDFNPNAFQAVSVSQSLQAFCRRPTWKQKDLRIPVGNWWTYSQRFDQLRKYVSTDIFLSQSQRIMMDRKFCSHTSCALPYQESLNSITVCLSTIIYISTTNPANQVFVQREIYHYQKFPAETFGQNCISKDVNKSFPLWKETLRSLNA